MHGLGNIGKEGNNRHTYAMLNKVLPLASAYQNISKFYSGNSKFTTVRYHLVGLSIIPANLDTYSTKASTCEPKLVHHC